MFSLLQNTASSSHVGELNDLNLNFISPPTYQNSYIKVKICPGGRTAASCYFI